MLRFLSTAPATLHALMQHTPPALMRHNIAAAATRTLLRMQPRTPHQRGGCGCPIRPFNAAANATADAMEPQTAEQTLNETAPAQEAPAAPSVTSWGADVAVSTPAAPIVDPTPAAAVADPVVDAAPAEVAVAAAAAPVVKAKRVSKKKAAAAAVDAEGNAVVEEPKPKKKAASKSKKSATAAAAVAEGDVAAVEGVDAEAEAVAKKPTKVASVAKVKKATVPAEARARAKELSKLISAANKGYYGRTGASGLSDAEFDALFAELQAIEIEHPALLKPSSPTQKPGSDFAPTTATKKAKKNNLAEESPEAVAAPTTASHLIPMLSLDSVNSLDKVRAWDASLQKRLATLAKTATKKKKGVAAAAAAAATPAAPLVYSLELKYDGIAVSLIYEQLRLVRVLTRGTGLVGEDVTRAVARWVRNVPQTLPQAAFYNSPELQRYTAAGQQGTLEVRGEVILTKARQAQYTDFQRSVGAAKDAADTPARNLPAGLLRRDMSLVGGQAPAAAEAGEEAQPDNDKAAPPVLDFVAYSLHLHHPDIAHASPYIVQPASFSSSSSSASTPSFGGDASAPVAATTAAAADAAPASFSASTLEPPPVTTFPATQGQAIELLEQLGMPVRIEALSAASASASASSSSTAATAAAAAAPNEELIPVVQRCVGIESVVSALEHLCAHRESLDFAIDGAVVKLDGLASAHGLGATNHHPRGALAFKFAPKSATSVLESVDWQVGRSGRVVPVANFRPVLLDGVKVARASLHNVSTLQDLSLRLGDRVNVERRGDVIPYITSKAAAEAGDAPVGQDQPLVHIPRICPCAEASELVLQAAVTDPTRVELCCQSASCPLQKAQAIEFYCSKGCMDIRGMGEATVSLLSKAGFVSSPADIVGLTQGKNAEPLLAAAEAGEIPGFGPKSAQKLIDAIESAHASASDEQLLVSLGIPRLGLSQARALLDHIGSLQALLDCADPGQLQDIPGVGPKSAEALAQAFASHKDSELVQAWRDAGILGKTRTPKPTKAKAKRAKKGE